MKKEQQNFLTHPSKKLMVIVSFLWVLALVLQVLVVTDLFTESLFRMKYIVVYLGLVISGLFVKYLWSNYNNNTLS